MGGLGHNPAHHYLHYPQRSVGCAKMPQAGVSLNSAHGTGALGSYRLTRCFIRMAEAREMAKTSSYIPRSYRLGGDRLPLRQAVPLVVTLSIASWVAVIGVVWLGRLAVSYLAGI
jgi:hypothetical protein